MKIGKFTVLAILVVVLSIVQQSAYGRPSEDFSGTVETNTTRNGWFRKFSDHGHDCNHGHGSGGVFNWVKRKLGFAKTSTMAPPTTTSIRPDDTSSQQPETENGQDDVPMPGNSEENARPETGNERPETENERPVTENERPENENRDESVGVDVLSSPDAENNRGTSTEDLSPPDGEDETVTNTSSIDLRNV